MKLGKKCFLAKGRLGNKIRDNEELLKRDESLKVLFLIGHAQLSELYMIQWFGIDQMISRKILNNF